jgi:6-pyruvoyltetrahydropterin/6-carboxytetrahydropterin synthase
VHTITKSFEFAASHQILRLPSGHKCARTHGHSYQLTVAITGDLDTVGFVIDFGELQWIGDLIASTLDHRHLNDVIDLNPTSENIATWMLKRVQAWMTNRQECERITEIAVTVSESRSSSASTRAILG